MSTELDDLFNFLDDDTLTIPGIRSREFPDGKAYSIPSPDAETGMRLSVLAEIGTKIKQGVQVSDRDKMRLHFDDDEERDFAQQVLGPVYEEMLADGVSWVRIQRVTQYAYVHFAFSPEAAQEAARRGVFAGKAPARGNRAQRRADKPTGKAPKAPRDSTATRARPSK